MYNGEQKRERKAKESAKPKEDITCLNMLLRALHIVCLVGWKLNEAKSRSGGDESKEKPC